RTDRQWNAGHQLLLVGFLLEFRREETGELLARPPPWANRPPVKQVPFAKMEQQKIALRRKPAEKLPFVLCDLAGTNRMHASAIQNKIELIRGLPLQKIRQHQLQLHAGTHGTLFRHFQRPRDEIETSDFIALFREVDGENARAAPQVQSLARRSSLLDDVQKQLWRFVPMPDEIFRLRGFPVKHRHYFFVKHRKHHRHEVYFLRRVAFVFGLV